MVSNVTGFWNGPAKAQTQIPLKIFGMTWMLLSTNAPLAWQYICMEEGAKIPKSICVKPIQMQSSYSCQRPIYKVFSLGGGVDLCFCGKLLQRFRILQCNGTNSGKVHGDKYFLKPLHIQCICLVHIFFKNVLVHFFGIAMWPLSNQLLFIVWMSEHRFFSPFPLSVFSLLSALSVWGWGGISPVSSCAVRSCVSCCYYCKDSISGLIGQ